MSGGFIPNVPDPHARYRAVSHSELSAKFTGGTNRDQADPLRKGDLERRHQLRPVLVAGVVERTESAGKTGGPVKRLPIKGLALLVAAELVTREHEHTQQGGTCWRCGEDFPCMHIRWAKKAREFLGWPPRASDERVMTRV